MDDGTRTAVRVGIVFFVALALLSAVAVWLATRGERPDAALSARIAQVAAGPDGSELRLSDVTDFDWDRAHVFGCYTTEQEIDAELGFRWRAAAVEDIGSYDSVALLVFVADGRVVRHVLHPRRDGDLTPLDGAGPFTPETAVFVVRLRDQGPGAPAWRELRTRDDPDGR